MKAIATSQLVGRRVQQQHRIRSRAWPFQAYQAKAHVPDDVPDTVSQEALDKWLNILAEATKKAAPKGEGFFLTQEEYVIKTMPHEEDTKGLEKALAKAIGKEIGASGIAAGSWRLSTVPATMSQQELTNFLVANKLPRSKPQILQRKHFNC